MITLKMFLFFATLFIITFASVIGGPLDKTTNTVIQSQENAEDFICSEDGFFPDPNNCHNYYTCVKGKAEKHNCKSSYFNSKSESCDSTYSTCTGLSCGNKHGVKVAYIPNHSFYGYCVSSEVYRMDRCPGRFQLDEKQQICVPVCEKAGIQPDPYDSTMYYDCIYPTSCSRLPHVSCPSLSLTHLSCPGGEIFDALNLHCAQKKRK